MRKIYYVPGLISALLIPILFWYYINTKGEQYECLLCHDLIVTFEEPTFMDKILDFMHREYYKTFFENISKLPKGAFIIIFGFLLFLNISMLSIKERFQLN